MPCYCCIPECDGNKPYGTRVSVFQFPKDRHTLQRWLQAINGKCRQLTENSRVCQKHFKPEDIITETSAYDAKRKISITVPLKNFRLQPFAVPCIFEDYPAKQPKKVKKSPLKDTEEKDNNDSEVATSMQRKNAKSPLSLSDGNKLDKTDKLDDEKKETVKSPKKLLLTTDRPIITVIKAEEPILDKEKSPEKMEVNNEDPAGSLPSSKSSAFPSPFKNLPNVSVCLKEEDRVPVVRELKGVKRSPSTGSNSSTGSSDVQKSLLLMKKRKVEKPAPVVLGRQNDCYCWMCHRENISLTCIACPRAYHLRCAGEINTQMAVNTTDWVCPECQRILSAENVDSRSSTLAEISLDRLGALLKLSLNKMKQRAPIAFHQPVSLEHYPKYLHYVIHPMDFSLLEKNIKQKVYGCTEAFLADVKWISHNSCVFNGTQHPLSTNAKNLMKACDQDMQEIEVCPDCFVHSVVRNKYWFSEVCRKPHPLVWAKLKGFPYWPAKVVRIADGNVDARFFGAHDRAWVPVSQCYHLSKEMPTTSKPKKKGNYEVALDELNVHVHFLIQKFGCFEYAPCRTCFSPQDKTLMYHGIDIDKVSKEDIAIESNPQRELSLLNFEKENRFASFLESESEKSNAEERSLNGNQFEIQSNHIFNKIGAKSSSFPFIKQRISTDSNVSEKEMSADESKLTAELKSAEDLKSDNELKSKNESKSTNEQMSIDLPKSADEPENTSPKKKIDSSFNVSEKESVKLSDSDQSRKLELALQRIKGYVSLNLDSEKENEIQDEENEVQDEENEIKDKDEESEKNSPVVTENDKTEKSKVLSPIFKKSITLPVVQLSESQETVEDVSVVLEATKKTDSFYLKLNETIESCKAKLGISEINDDLSSDESANDDNESRSDEDEEDETSTSEAEEEASEEDEEEIIEVSDEEVENKVDDAESDEVENENKIDDAESDEEESESQDSELTDTDIESSNETSPKKLQKSNFFNTDNKNNENEAILKNMNLANEDNMKNLTNDSNEAIITNPDMQVPEVTIDESDIMEVEENSVSESSNDVVKENSESSLSVQANEIKVAKVLASSQESMDDSVYEARSNSFSEASKEESSNMECVEINDSHSSYDLSVNKNNSPFKNIVNNSSPIKKIASPRRSSDKKSEDIKPNLETKLDDLIVNKGATSPPRKNQAEEEDDDDDDEVLICTPTRPKSPPVIVLDDDQENENSSASDTFAIKSPPYSTSVDSLSNEENTNCRTNSGDDPNNHNNHGKTVAISAEISHEEVIGNNEEKNANTNLILISRNSEERRKRKFSSDSSTDADEDDIQVVTPKKPALTGAIRTFHKPNNGVSSLKPITPTVESVKRNLEKESLSQIDKSPVLTEDTEKEATSPQNQQLKNQLLSPTIAERLLKSTVDTSNMSDKDKEIFYLKSKLNCVLTAYQIQSWKCSQEREELRHNMNLIIMEMRACLESDKKQSIEALSKKFEQEREKSINDAKRKQWCAYCLMESRYACCWNTSYCSTECQRHHFPEHRHSCSQLKTKSEVLELKQKGLTTNSENKEGKKVFILTKPLKPKPSDASQQLSGNNSQMQIKQQLQIASSSNIQFVLAPVKSSAESTIATSTPSVTSSGSKEQHLDSPHIVGQIRNRSCDLSTALTLIKKKNLEALNNFRKIEEAKETKQKEADLEDIYFPSPPKITFEGYESATPDPNLILESDEAIDESYIDPDDLELPKDATLEPDVVLSDTDERDNEMVNIGHGIELKAKFLNKCLVYGQTAKKLTRCLVDVIFPDIKLLATCSAFGQKSNVTKLTRAALPTRKVQAIIDYVSKRFPGASRSEIVLQMNMKCKEARVILSKRESELPKKTMGRRLLAREKEGELATTGSTTSGSSSITSILTSPIVTSPAPGSNIVPNVVCVKSTNSNMFSFSAPNNPSSIPNILRSQILIKPKPMSQPVLSTVGKAAILQSAPLKKRDTVRNLLAANKMKLPLANLANDTRQFVMAVDSSKSPTLNTQVVSSSTPPATSNMRPYIILGSQVNPVKSPSSTSTQNSPLPVPSATKK